LHDHKTALKIYKEELAKRALAYTRQTNQKLQKNVATILSAVVNLEQHHTLQDLQPILDKLEQDLDTKIISASIHRDEGTLIEKSTGKKFFSGEDFALNQDKKLYWIDEKKNFLEPINLEQFKIKKNYHAHIEFLGIDSNGKAIKHNRLHKHYLSALQDFVAETLQMERGRKKSKNRHKDPNVFKQEGVAKREAQEELEKTATIKALKVKAINKQIRSQLQQHKAQRKHYARWESYYKELQEYVKTEKPTIGAVMELIGQFVGELLTDIQELQNAPAPEPQVIVKEDTAKIERLQKELEEEKAKNAKLVGLLKKQEEEIERLKRQLQELKQLRYRERKEREEEIRQLKEALKGAKKELAEYQNEDFLAKMRTGELVQRWRELVQQVDDHFHDLSDAEFQKIQSEIDQIEEELKKYGIGLHAEQPPKAPKKSRNYGRGMGF